MVIVGTLRGEFLDLDPTSISLKSGLAFAYLVLFPFLGAFSSYLWLLKNTSPDRASTYAYVNPVVAVILGWALRRTDQPPHPHLDHRHPPIPLAGDETPRIKRAVSLQRAASSRPLPALGLLIPICVIRVIRVNVRNSPP